MHVLPKISDQKHKIPLVQMGQICVFGTQCSCQDCTRSEKDCGVATHVVIKPAVTKNTYIKSLRIAFLPV